MMSAAKKFISTYLDNPIIRNERDRYLLKLLEARSGGKVVGHPAEKKKIQQLLETIGDDDLESLDPEYYPSFDTSLIPEDRISEIQDAARIAHRIFSQADSGARTWGSPGGLGVDLMDFSLLQPITLAWFNRMRQLDDIINTIGCVKANGERGLIRARSGNLFYTGDEYFGVVKFDDVATWYILTYTQLLMFKDMFYGRFNSSIACIQIYRSPLLHDTLVECLDWFYECLGTYGNHGYEIGKSIESLAKANLVRHCDPILGTEGSYEVQLENMRAKEKNRGKTSNFLADKLDALLLRDLPVPELVELFGLQKLSGHPLLDPEVGGKSVKEEARKKINYKWEDIRRLRNNCCRIYVEGYIRRNSEWPPLKFGPSSKRTKLYQLYSLKELKITRDSYDFMEWEDVRFEKHYDFDYYPNFTDLMDDKTISFYRDEAAATWRSKIKTRSSKRLLLEMLSRPEISIREIVERVRIGDIPYSWFIVSLYPKEREFKIAARMFSMMVFEMRAFFAAVEANIADKVFPNLPQQTMTLSKQEIQELFHKITEATTDEDVERLFLEVDLTRWNLRWHPEVVDPVACDLDEMFGLPGVFTTIHHFFEKCLILVRVPACEPEGIDLDPIPETNLAFYKHRVGFEGIGQKQWSFLTYGVLDLGIGDLAGRFYLIGQADNQTVTTTISCRDVVDRTAHIRAIAKRIAAGIEEECSKVGHEAKSEECQQSTNVITYSKDVYIKGVEHFTSIKAFSRVFPHSASDFPSIDGSIGAISGQCLAGAERTKKPMNAFALWCFHAALYLTRLRTNVFIETSVMSHRFPELLTDRVIYGLMVLPGELGGTQIAPVTSFFYKGGSDPISKAYASLKFYQGSSSMVRKMIGCLHGRKWFRKDPDLTLLIEDPYGLPLDRPVAAESSILTESKSKVCGVTVNHELKEITGTSVTEYEKALQAELMKCRPFNPVLLSDILGWSIVGVQRTVSKMFSSTRTIQGLLQSHNDEDLSLEDASVCTSILAAGSGHFMNIVARLSRCTEGERRITSIFSDVVDMRQAWDTSNTIEMSGVTSYVPFDLPLSVSLTPSHHQGFRAYIAPPDGCDPFHSRGNEDPYIGRSTQEKRSEHGYKITTSSAPERAVKRLADIATQPGVSLSFRQLVSDVAKSRANVDLNETYPLIGEAEGGTIDHRFHSTSDSQKASGLGSMSMASSCTLNTDHASPISGGEEDYPVMIQAIMVCLIAVGVLHYSRDSKPVFITLRTDSTKWIPLVDEDIVVNDPKELPILYLAGNRIATVDEITLQRTHGPLLSPFTSTLTEVASTGYKSQYALRRMVGRALYTSHSASLVADKGTGLIRFHMDLLELRGCGIMEVADAMAGEIAKYAIEAMFSRSSTGLRWTPIPLITSLSEALSRTLASMVAHPMFKDDDLVVNYLSESPFQYRFANQTITKKMRDIIARKAVQLFTDPSSWIFTDKDVLFVDDRQNIVSQAVVIRLKLILFQSVALSQCSSDTVFTIIRRTIPASLRLERDEEDRIGALHRMCINLAHWAHGSGLVYLEEHLTSLYQGRMLYISGITASALLRDARQFDAIKHISSQALLLKTVQLDQEDNSGLRWVRDTSTLPFFGFNTLFNPMDEEYIRFSLSRLSGRIYGRDSAAGYSYVPITPLAAGRVCVIIGNGYGSGAAVLLNYKATHIYTLDLWEDLSENSKLCPGWSPPALRSATYASKYTCIETSPRLNGDIRSSSTAALINQYTGAGSLYLVDVPLLTRDDLTKVLSTLTLLPPPVQVIIRLITSSSDKDLIYSTLQEAGTSPMIVPVHFSHGHGEYWVSLAIPAFIEYHGVDIVKSHPFQERTSPFPNLSFLGGGREYLEEVIEGPYYQTSDDQMQGSMQDIEGLLALSVGHLEHRFTYRQWTEVIHIWCARRARLSLAPRDEIVEIHSQDMVTVTIGNHTVPVSVTGSLRHLLTRTVARLL